MTLQEFIKKAKEKENNKVKIVHFEVEGFGKIEFIRPTESDLIKFNNDLASCIDVEYKGISDEEKRKKEINIESFDFSKYAAVSSEFIYKCCSFLREKEVRDMYPDTEFYDIPLVVFGQNEVIKIASELNNQFKGVETRKEVTEAVKN